MRGASSSAIIPRSAYDDAAHGSVAKWSNAPDCKSGGLRLRGFESLPAHHSPEIYDKTFLSHFNSAYPHKLYRDAFAILLGDPSDGNPPSPKPPASHSIRGAAHFFIITDRGEIAEVDRDGKFSDGKISKTLTSKASRSIRRRNCSTRSSRGATASWRLMPPILRSSGNSRRIVSSRAKGF